MKDLESFSEMWCYKNILCVFYSETLNVSFGHLFVSLLIILETIIYRELDLELNIETFISINLCHCENLHDFQAF